MTQGIPIRARQTKRKQLDKEMQLIRVMDAEKRREKESKERQKAESAEATNAITNNLAKKEIQMARE